MKQNFENSDTSSSNNPQTRRGFLKKIFKLGLLGGGAYIAHRELKNVPSAKEIFDLIVEKTKNEKSKSEAEIRFEKLIKQLINEWPSKDKLLPNREVQSPQEFKKPDCDFIYREYVAEPKIENSETFENPGKFGLEGWSLRFIQALRFQPLTMAVERKYNLPRNLLLAMLLQESSGEEFLPNAKNDGGFGLIHMQSGTARDFGVPVYKNCNAIVCDGIDKRSCTDEEGHKISHAKELRALLEKNINNREAISELDGRLNHLENIDAAGRMISFHMARHKDTLKTLPDNLKDLGPLRAAVCKYSGPINFPEYWERIRTFMALLSDSNYLNNLYAKLEKVRDSGEINNRPMNYSNYINEWQMFLALNYGVEEYVQGRCYSNTYSDSVLNTYQSVLPEVDENVISKFGK